jgi:hypothetical protein
MKIFKNLLKLAKLSAIRPVFTSKTFFSSNIVGSYGSPAKARVAVKKKRADFASARFKRTFFSPSGPACLQFRLP